MLALSAKATANDVRLAAFVEKRNELFGVAHRKRCAGLFGVSAFRAEKRKRLQRRREAKAPAR
jgi:hypothetical protein